MHKDLGKFMEEYFPSLAVETDVEKKRNEPGQVATGKKKRQRVTGRTWDQVNAQSEKEESKKLRKAEKKSKPRDAEENNEVQRELDRKTAIAERDARAAKRSREPEESVAAASQVAESAEEAPEPNKRAKESVEKAQVSELAGNASTKQTDEGSDEWTSTWKDKTQPMYALNTEVNESKQKGAGLGLFMLEKAKKGKRVAVYAGELITQKQADDR